MPSRVFQGIIQQMKDAIDRVIGVMDENGVVISCSDTSKVGEVRQHASEELQYTLETVSTGGYTYRPINPGDENKYIAFVEGDDKYAEKMTKVLAVSLLNIKNVYDDKFDKATFIKNIITDNILPSEIYLKCKELHFNMEESRVVYLIKFNAKTDLLPYEILQKVFPDKSRDFIVAINETDLVVIKEVSPDETPKDIEEQASTLADTLGTEFYTRVSIGISSVVDNIKNLPRAYKEAQLALEIGKVFESEKNIINYENMGIGRLIYQLPTTLCEIFLSEVFKNGNLESLDRETLLTIRVFFENSLNVSETSRKLFVHRNTLVYRLDKIQKLTGLDLRNFEDAITFKVALLVKKYLSSKSFKY